MRDGSDFYRVFKDVGELLEARVASERPPIDVGRDRD
jgi:hypothetical protein